jgi:hypothetical protein
MSDYVDPSAFAFQAEGAEHTVPPEAQPPEATPSEAYQAEDGEHRGVSPSGPGAPPAS